MGFWLYPHTHCDLCYTLLVCVRKLSTREKVAQSLSKQVPRNHSGQWNTAVDWPSCAAHATVKGMPWCCHHVDNYQVASSWNIQWSVIFSSQAGDPGLWGCSLAGSELAKWMMEYILLWHHATFGSMSSILYHNIYVSFTRWYILFSFLHFRIYWAKHLCGVLKLSSCISASTQLLVVSGITTALWGTLEVAVWFRNWSITICLISDCVCHETVWKDH